MSAAESVWETIPFGSGVTLLVRDANGLAALDKPAGVLSHPNESQDRPRCLIAAHYDAAEECYRWTPPGTEESRSVWLLNRLDSATSGVILLASDRELARAIRAAFRQKQVAKTYQALVFGRPPRPAELWRDTLTVTKKEGQIRTRTGGGGMPAESRMKVVRAKGVGAGAFALIQLEPRTGRSHQLRAQCTSRHLPIVGDQTYGDFARNREFARLTGERRLFLHSLATRFEYTWRGRAHTFAATAPLPEAFERVF